MTTAVQADLTTKFTAVRSALCAALVERDEEIDLCLTALVAKEHILLVGPPGLAKSALLNGLLACAVGKKFSALLTRFSVPEELFGPVSLAALKASSAILNTLLKVLNERVYDAGDGVSKPVPLRLCVASSNKWPDSESSRELAAIFDRLLFRKAVSPVRSATGRQRLLWASRPAPHVAKPLTASDLDTAHAAAMALPWSIAGREALETILKELAKEGVRPGDRRQVKTVGAVQAFALLAGAELVQPEHLEIAQHTLWDDPAEQPQKVAQVIARIANPTGMRITQLLLEVKGVLAAADVRNLAEAAKAAAKLGEIDRQLGALSGNGRLEKARAYLKDQLKKLKLASIEAV
jgi:MoxR-like ATPase